ncbi:unnamed protein product [Ceutorhynchus assimilis]|uniref:Methyltransferase domain-containing protein n=1 Tax=Ceutorhynchus assimilis TaxID=467358 RepID=A0A9P0DHE0_9CUCU|nr:unnamed protein product [Ceutorhynchus assimilis]
MLPNKLKVIEQIKQISEHLEMYLPLANVHMVDYFTKQVFFEYTPKNIREEASNYGYKNIIEAIYSQETDIFPCINQYIEKSQEFTLKNTKLCMSFDQFKETLQTLGCNEITSLKLDIFMNAKKSHEVEILSGIAAAIKTLSKTSHLIDIGDGKGYLSSMLALHHKIPVLGVDASEINTNGAVDRANKLSKVWNGVVSDVKTRETSISFYKQVTKFVDEKVNFAELIENIFLQKSNRLGLVGLHTCGNLTPSCLKIFKASDEIKSICNVGCCYHHLTEEGQLGFPLSEFLKKQNYVIGRNARMIAAQSIERILHKKERPSRAMFYRALFQIIIETNSRKDELKNKQVGRFRKESPNFLDYVKKASKRINMNLELSDDDIRDLYSQYEHRIDEMDLFYLIRAMLAPVVESLILLDRLLFLYENSFKNSFLVQLFDPVVSPRCYCIVSIKN